MAQILRIKRHLGAKQAPTPAQVGVGEMAYNKHEAAGAGGHNDLWIGDGTAAHLMVGADRQVEITGDQNVAGIKTFASMVSLPGGAANNVLSTNGAGALSWVAPVAVPPALTLKGEFNATPPNGAIENAVAPLANGALPAAAPANNGFFLIVNTEGTITGGAAPHEHMAVGDWIVSTGTAWIHINLHFAIVAASNVATNAITGMTGVTDVQVALEWLHAQGVTVATTAPATPRAGMSWFDTTTPPGTLNVYNGTAWVAAMPPGAAATVVADQTSITGDGAATGTGATGPLTVALVDGGTY